MKNRTVEIDSRNLETISFYLDWMAQKLHADAFKCDEEDDRDYFHDHEYVVRELEEIIYKALETVKE